MPHSTDTRFPRRRFLKTTGAAAAVTALSPLVGWGANNDADPYGGFKMSIQSFSLRAFDVKTALQHIKTQSHRAGDIIRRLRSFVKPESVDLVSTDMNTIIDEIRPLAEVDANANNIAISFDVSTNLPEIIADQLQIQQVLLNLLRNGIDAMRDNDPEDRRLELHCYISTPDTVRIDVIDRGHGITEEAGKKLFHPFFTTKSTEIGRASCRERV